MHILVGSHDPLPDMGSNFRPSIIHNPATWSTTRNSLSLPATLRGAVCLRKTRQTLPLAALTAPPPQHVVGAD